MDASVPGRDTRWVRSRQFAARDLGDRVVLCSLGWDTQVHELRGALAVTWRLLAQPLELDDLGADLVRRGIIPAPRDVRSLVQQLDGAGIAVRFG